MTSTNHLTPSGERFTVTYCLTGNEHEARDEARDICVEQTIEFPLEFVDDQSIRDTIVGEIASFRKSAADRYEAVISYAVEISGMELPQLLNVLFGNISLKTGIRLERFDLPDPLLRAFPGPRYGRSGLRDLLGVTRRPLIATALKPMGLSPRQLADLAYRLVAAGIDILKDDHGLADQSFCPFRERISYCAEAVARANRERGSRSLYMPNITGPAGSIPEAARYVKKNGGGGLLISPGLTGFDAVNQLASDPDVCLPIMCHPSFLGTYALNPTEGLSYPALLGQLPRLAGADITVYPNFGGRFPIGREDCLGIACATVEPMGSIAPSFPSPSGGLTMSRIGETCELFGADIVMLIGGDLHRRGTELEENAREFLKQVEKLEYV